MLIADYKRLLSLVAAIQVLAAINMRQIPNSQEFYVEISLYDKIQFEEGASSEIYDLVYTTETIDMYCLGCGSHSVFLPENNVPGDHLRGTLTKYSFQMTLKSRSFIVQKDFVCSRNNKHTSSFFTLIEDYTITKIGQTPALAEIASYDIKKYRKILGDQYYNEFSKAVGLFAHGIGVGSFVYLRRIIENFVIKPAYEAAKLKAGWSEEVFQKSRMKERIDLLKAELPDFLVANTGLYSIVSKGIHELSEDECKAYFPVLKDSIEFILTELEAKRQTALKKEQLGKSINSISQKLK
jgi:hypothetical protein